MAFLFLVVAAASACLASGQTRIELDGAGWTLQNENETISVSAVVPGSFHLDLARAGIIGDVFYSLGPEVRAKKQCKEGEEEEAMKKKP